MFLKMTNSDFHDLFRSMGRHEQFSYEAKNFLFDWYDEIMGDDWPVDVIAICCEWCEYESIEEVLEDYDVDDIEDLDYAIELDNGNVLVMNQ